MSFLGACFGFLVTSPLGFKARVGSALFAIFAEANVMYIPQDSPLVLHLPTSWQPARSRSLPHMHVQRWDLARFRTCNRTNRRRTRYHCASDPTRLPKNGLIFRAMSDSVTTDTFILDPDICPVLIFPLHFMLTFLYIQVRI